MTNLAVRIIIDLQIYLFDRKYSNGAKKFSLGEKIVGWSIPVQRKMRFDFCARYT